MWALLPPRNRKPDSMGVSINTHAWSKTIYTEQDSPLSAPASGTLI